MRDYVLNNWTFQLKFNSSPLSVYLDVLWLGTSKHGCQSWTQMGQIWDFLIWFSVHFVSVSQNLIKQIVQSPRFVPFGSDPTESDANLYTVAGKLAVIMSFYLCMSYLWVIVLGEITRDTTERETSFQISRLNWIMSTESKSHFIYKLEFV